MHLADADLQSLADGESLAGRDPVTLAHLASCPACAGALARALDAQARDAELLGTLDGPVPAVSPDAVKARAAHALRLRRARRRTAMVGAAWLLGAAVAAAMVASPLRHLAIRAVKQVAAAGTNRKAVTHRVPVTPPPPEGVAFRAGSEVVVSLRAAQPEGALHVSLVPGTMVRLTQRGGPAAYALTASGVVVENAGSTASFDLELPITVARAEVRVAGQLVFRKLGTTIVPDGPRDRDGGYTISLASQFPKRRRVP